MQPRIRPEILTRGGGPPKRLRAAELQQFIEEVDGALGRIACPWVSVPSSDYAIPEPLPSSTIIIAVERARCSMESTE